MNLPWAVLLAVQSQPIVKWSVVSVGNHTGWCSGTQLSRYVFRRSLVHITVGVMVPSQ